MVIKRILCAALLLAGLMTSADVSAQSTETRWKGSDYNSVVESGEEFFLYNVGTGKFIVNGGDWGVEGRLFYDDLGKSFTFTSQSGNLLIYSSTVTGATTACYFGINIPKVTSGGDWGDATAGTLMDANYNYYGGVKNGNSWQITGTRNWTFTQVETSDGSITYYMSERINGLATGKTTSNTTTTTYYLGAAYGMNYEPGQMTNLDEERETGLFVFIDDDRTTFTTAESFNLNKNDKFKIFEKSTSVSGDELYQWRIVTRSDFEKQVTSAEAGSYGGLSTNLSYRIFDQDMSRNDVRFYNSTQGWVVKNKPGETYNTDDGHRYAFTYGIENQASNGTLTKHQDNKLRDGEAWYTPVRLKEQWDETKDAKFGFLSFEGIGTVSTYIEAPADGWYQITCYAFCESESDDNRGYVFASVNNATSGVGYVSNTIKRVAPGFFNTLPFSVRLSEDKSYGATRTTEKKYHYCEAAGNLLTDNDYNAEYAQILLIHADQNDKIYFGVGKDKATRSSRDYRSGSNYWGYTDYFHDTDWIGADNFQITYLGEDYVDFNEDYESLDYLKEDNGADKQYTNKSTRLKRTFKANSWNSFVFPLDMTAVQVRQAFGDGTKLAVLDGLGTKSGNPNVIDFVVKELPAEGNAIEKGKFYLIKPVKNPNADGFYNLGRGTFNTAEFPEIAEVPVEIGAGLTHSNKAKSKATYVRTKDYESFDKNNPTEPYVKAYREEGGVAYGSYVMGANTGDTQTTMYVVKNNMRIKGFRGWIEDVALGGSAKVAFDGVFDDTDDIEIIPTSENKNSIGNGNIYDLSGRKVSSETDALPKGIYIVNGKKFIVK